MEDKNETILTASAGGSNSIAENLLSIIRASQAISSEIFLNNLLKKLMKIVIENSGAQRGFLVLKERGDFIIEVEGEIDKGEIKVLKSDPHKSYQRVQHPIINYVRKTGEVYISDISPAIQDNPPAKSVLCLPIIRRTKFIGILYLENDLMPNAFTKDKITVLELLISQIAISLENARLYDTLTYKEEFYRLLIENSSDITTILDSNANFKYVSRSVEKILGYKVDDMIGKNVFEFIHSDDKPKIFNAFTQIIKNPNITPSEQCRFRHSDGLWHIHESIAYNLISNPIVKGIIVNSRDITEKVKLQTDAMKSGHLASLGELAAGVAHEINNPISGIINYAQILANKSVTDSIERDIANRIIKEGDRIANIVRSLLSFAREDKEEKKPVHIREIISDTLALTEAQIQKDGITLKTKVPEELPQIIANPHQIQQVFLNVISNARYALKHKNFKNHEDKIIEIQAEEITIDNCLCLRITFYDTGSGIPSDKIYKILDPFFTTKPRGEGTGLGLSISHGIISGHGGKLVIDSVKGEFTKVIIILPARGKSEGKNSCCR